MVPTSDLPKMAASQSLRLETLQAEANHAEAKRKIEELDRHYHAQERMAFAEFNEKARAISAQFEGQMADVTAQLQPSLRASIEAALRKTKDLEIDLLRRAHQEQADARRKDYDMRKEAYDHDLFKAITALMTSGVSRLPALAALTRLKTLSLINHPPAWAKPGSFASPPIAAFARTGAFPGRRWPGYVR